MSLRSRRRRHLRRHPPTPPVVLEAIALPSYDRRRLHSWYAADALRTLAKSAFLRGIPIRGDVRPLSEAL